MRDRQSPSSTSLAKRTSILLCLTMLASLGAASVAADDNVPERVAVDASIERQDNRFLCRLKVSDLETGEIFAEPILLFESGESGKLVVGTDSGGALKVEVTADAEAGTANLTVTGVEADEQGVVKERVLYRMSLDF